MTAIVTAYQRLDATCETIRRLKDCDPAPAEIIVHVDGGEKLTSVLKQTFPELKVIESPHRLGPGGARNRLINAAVTDLVASFDDDSSPVDRDYFLKVTELASRFEKIAVFDAHVFLPAEPIPNIRNRSVLVESFSGGACIYRRDVFLELDGYVPIPIAYDMEEVDVALQLADRGHRILRSDALRVLHDTDLQRHSHPSVTASSISNIALFIYLRYPVWLWSIGLVKVLSRIVWCMRHGRVDGIFQGLKQIGESIARYRSYRRTVRSATILRSLLRKRTNQVVK